MEGGPDYEEGGVEANRFSWLDGIKRLHLMPFLRKLIPTGFGPCQAFSVGNRRLSYKECLSLNVNW